MIDDDRFILETWENWSFGYDNSGNVMNQANIKHTWERAKELGPITLVTCDGSIDCSHNPNEQEEETALLVCFLFIPCQHTSIIQNSLPP